MQWAYFVIVLLLVSGLVISIYDVFTLSASGWKKALFITIRSMLFLLLGAALFEPVFTFKKLRRTQNGLAVYVDCSKSMRAFSVDSLVTTLQKDITGILEEGNGSAQKVTWYSFGDSLRLLPKPLHVQADDHNSFLPLLTSENGGRSHNRILLITDANFSNEQIRFDGLEAADVRYLRLHATRQPEFLKMEVPDIITDTAGMASLLTLSVEGACTSPHADIICKVYSGNTVIEKEVYQSGASCFAKKIVMKLPPETGGLHLYDVTVECSEPNVQKVQETVLRHTVQGVFTYEIISDAPSLDIRFMRNALSSRSIFTMQKTGEKKSADVHFTFGDLPKKIDGKPGLIINVISTGSALNQSDYSVHVSRLGYENPFSEIEAAALPPVPLFTTNKKTLVKNVYLSAHSGNDSFPIVYDGIYQGVPVLTIAIKDFWKWDFLPLSLEKGESDGYLFTGNVLDYVHDRLSTLTSDTLLGYFGGQTIEGRAPALSIAVNGGRNSDSATFVSCVVEREDGTVNYDTMFTFAPFHPMVSQVRLRPAEKGLSRITLSTKGQDRACSHRLTFDIVPDQSETSVSSQNEALLKELGRPLDPGDYQSLNTFIRQALPTEGSMGSEEGKISIQRSWLLLCLLFIFLFAEWIIRKFDDID